MNKTQDNEIDLLEFFHTIYDGKWIISGIVAISVSHGGTLQLLKENEYESRLIYSIDTTPPFYEQNEILMEN